MIIRRGNIILIGLININVLIKDAKRKIKEKMYDFMNLLLIFFLVL